MTTERFHRIEELYIAAHALPAEQRTGFVMTTCADDAELASEVITLLARDARTAGLADLCTPTDPSPDEAGHPVAPGATFGAYQIIEELGRGSMGIVYRATQTHPHHQVALKLLHAGYAPDEVRHRFGVEAEMLARLNHRGIAQIYAAGTVSTPHGSQPYIAMELVDGQPLLTYARAMRLDTSARVALLALICDAVEHAHQHGVIHRDLKPAHILVVDEPRGPRPVILDFGVARLMNPDQAAATRSTRHGQIIGTPAYMSPEQVDGNPAGIDTRCDVYALGAIGYELLAGRLPIDVDTASLHAGLHAILDRPIKPLASHGRQFGGDLSRVIGQALAKNKAQRYGSVAALAADLRNVLAHRPISARPPRAFYVLAKLARRHRLTTASFCLGAVLAVAGLVRAHLAQQALQNHYTETRDVAAFLAREFADQLDEIGGTNVVRRALLLRLRAQVEHLLRYDPHDPKLLTAYGDVLQNLSNIEMAEGAYEAALALRQEAVALCRQLAAGQPDDLERQADLSIALVLVGDILADWGDFAATRALFEEAAAIDEQIVRQMPDSRRFQSNLLWSYVRLAQVMDHLDDLAAVTAHVAAAEQKVQEILTRDPQNTDALHAGMCLTAFVIDRRAKLGRAAEYAELSRTFLNYARRLMTLAPDNCMYQSDCTRALRHTSKCARQAGDLDAATELLAEADRLTDRLLRLDPHDARNLRARRDVLRELHRLAKARGEPAAAAAHSEAAAALAERLVAQGPNVWRDAMVLMDISAQCAAALRDLGREADARRYGERARETAFRLGLDPRVMLPDAVKCGRLLLRGPLVEQRDPEAARQILGHVLEMTGGQYEPAWELLGQLHADRKEFVRARECYENALGLLPADETAMRDTLRSTIDKLPTTGDNDGAGQ